MATSRTTARSRESSSATPSEPPKPAEPPEPAAPPSGAEPFNLPEPLFRPLRVFAFDPSHGSRLGNVMTLHVPYEPLKRGPVGERIAVVDYDGARDRFYPPVDLDDPRILLQGGLPPHDSDPRFHQQMVYAVVSQTLRTFDRALGREVRFRFQRRVSGSDTRNHSHLRIYPHGVNEANAYYSRELRALVFGYFPASADDAGPNIPGQPVFTCLSHDIIVHETCHAVVDGMREYFLEPTNRDTLAFHEAFADVIALLQHFTFPEFLLETIQRTGGLLYRRDLASELESDLDGVADGDGAVEANPLVSLARQFGEALGTRQALRSAIGVPPRKRDLETVMEPHARGAILVAAMFEAFFRVYTRRTRDLFRLAGLGPQRQGELHPDLAQRLCKEATTLADEFVLLCIRAIEYCPPVDLEFGDYLRALVTVHSRMDQDDKEGFRDALIRSFSRRGIFPPDVRSMSESELVWQPPVATVIMPDELLTAIRTRDREDAASGKKIAILAHQFFKQNQSELGLTPDAPIAVRSFHPYGFRLEQVQHQQDCVIEVIQTMDVPVGDDPKETVRVRGGTTLVVRSDGRVRYAIAKELHPRRRQAQIDHATGHSGSSASLYVAGSGEMNFQALHRGY